MHQQFLSILPIMHMPRRFDFESGQDLWYGFTNYFSVSYSNSSSNNAERMFKANDKVLCYHGPFLYEATVISLFFPQFLRALSEISFLIFPTQVLEAENRAGKGSDGVGPHYKVHYKGWKRTYDTPPPPPPSLSSFPFSRRSLGCASSSHIHATVGGMNGFPKIAFFHQQKKTMPNNKNCGNLQTHCPLLLPRRKVALLPKARRGVPHQAPNRRPRVSNVPGTTISKKYRCSLFLGFSSDESSVAERILESTRSQACHSGYIKKHPCR